MDPRPPPRCCGKQRPKKGSDYLVPQFSHCWPRWRTKNTLRNQPRLLVAINATGRKRLCKRMRHLSINQTKNKPTKTTPVPHRFRTKSTTVRNNRLRLHHKATQKRRERHDTHYH